MPARRPSLTEPEPRPTGAAGISLMETMVVIAIMLLMMIMISQIFALNYDIFAKQSKRTDNEIGAILATKTISQMARGAVAVEASRTIGTTTYTSSSTELVLKLPSIDASERVITGSFDYVAFYRSPTESAKIFAATEAAAGSIRLSNTRLVTAYNTTMIFRYNAPVITDADRVSLFVINSQGHRGVTLTTRGWTSIFLRNR